MPIEAKPLAETEAPMDIVLLSSGEWPSVGSLLFSQLFETARLLMSRGHRVQWLAAVPTLSRVKRLVLRRDDLEAIRQACGRIGLPFHCTVVPVTLGSPLSLPLRRFWLAHAARTLMVKGGLGRGDAPVVLHARSYDAAELALQLRARLDAAGTRAIASFDMRSWLPPEIPMGGGLAGRLAYGFWKEIEFGLLRDTDARFLPLDVSRRHYAEETGLSITFAPIQGFERTQGWQPDFDARWRGRRIGYAGSLGQWNDPALLEAFFELFGTFTPLLAAHPSPALRRFECRFYAIDDLPGYYDSLVAMVIPGLRTSAGYFETIKLRTNFFSTKAAEALSRGVPLIVSSRLAELAAFVREHDCGVVVDLDEAGRPVCPAELPDVGDEALWRRLTANATRVGARFTRHAVMATYLTEWRDAHARRGPRQSSGRS